MKTNNLDDLNSRVTNAIMQAERMPPGAEAIAAFTKVCLLEQLIAFETAPDSTEGGISRCGAVTAAISAGAHLRAIRLANLYCEQAVTPEIRERLREHMKTARSAWLCAVHPGPWIVTQSNPGYHYVDDANGRTVARADSADMAAFIAESANAYLRTKKVSEMPVDYPTHHDQCERAFAVIHEYGNDIREALLSAYGTADSHPAIALIKKIQDGTKKRAAAGTTP